MDIRLQQSVQPLSIDSSRIRKQERTTSFKEVLENKFELTMSKHASERLSNRNIQVTQEQWQQISRKLTEADKKGITEAVVIDDGMALVVSVKNRTIVTAMSRNEASNHIFSNINGTILLNSK